MSSEVKFSNLSKEQIESLMVLVESMGGATDSFAFETLVRSNPWVFDANKVVKVNLPPDLDERLRGIERNVARLMEKDALRELAEFKFTSAHGERLDAFNNLWRLALTIGVSKPGEDRWSFTWYEDGVMIIINRTVERRHNQFEFPTQEKCQRFIREGEKWMDVLWPKV